MTLFFTGIEVDIIAANAQISSNAGLPYEHTEEWAVPKASYSDPNLFFIIMPNEDGWTREDGTYFTQAQMIDGVVNVEIQESQSNWFPPPPYPPI